MHALRQSLRPKHQVLILKCYPRFQKSAIEVKPNSSELSYLLYYASTRRSKLQKVGDFLVEKTKKDVSRGKTNNATVTLQIVTALIDKCPRDLALYAHSILEVLTIILRSHDVNLVEESVPTFEAFCTHYISATLSADQDNVRRFDEIVQLYCSYASRDRASQPRGGSGSIPEAIRLRTAGLLAIKSLVSSESFGLDNGQQLNRVLPVILETLYSSKANYLDILQQRDEVKEKYEKDQAYRRRQSVSAARESQANEADPSTASASAAVLDQQADENIGVLAMQSLKQIFGASNRTLLRQSASAVLRFTLNRGVTTQKQSNHAISNAWMLDIFERISRWAPMQDRFIILVIVVETLLQSPIKEEDLSRQTELVNTIRTLLRSDINFIGLSVIDVLVGLIQHTLLLLQLGGSGSKVQPHPQQTDGTNSPGRAAPTTANAVVMEVVKSPSSPRLLLLEQLQHCIGDLGTHIYYSDQVGDIVSALLLRLKPSPTSAISSPVDAVENPSGAAEAIAASVSLREQPQADGFFSFDTARVIALNAVREVIIVANSKRNDGTNPAGRNRIDVSVWDGTQWLLRDSDGRVRRAYVDALLTWLALEVDKKAFRVVQESARSSKKGNANGLHHGHGSTTTISAAQKSKSTYARFSFLQLLHLAIYENALQYAHSEADILLLHLLLSRLVEKLGINSVRCGLPMVFRLQENVMVASNPLDFVSVGSLVHGYFWTLSETFDFDTETVGRTIHGEISRRSRHGIWNQDVSVPPVSLDRIPTPPTGVPSLRQSFDPKYSLEPFEAREDLIDAIEESYISVALAPPTSPTLSPGRAFSVSGARSNAALPLADQQLPAEIKQELRTPWTKEACIAAVEKELAGMISSHGSRRGNPPPGLMVDTSGTHTPGQARSLHDLRQLSVGSGPFLAAAFAADDRRNVSPGGLRTPLSSTSAQSVTRVTVLKQVLAGKAPIAPTHDRGGRFDEMTSDTGSDSMVAHSFSTSERSLTLPQHANNNNNVNVNGTGTAGVVSRNLNVAKKEHNRAPPHDHANDADVPPMAHLPPSSVTVDDSTGPRQQQRKLYTSPPPHQGNRTASVSGSVGVGRDAAGRIDPVQLLSRIDVSAVRATSAGGGGGGAAPPY